MSRAVWTIFNDADRKKVTAWSWTAPIGTRVEFKAARRSVDQNAKLWASLTDIAVQVEWYGQKLSPTDWKDVFTASLRKARVVPGIDPGNFVLLGLHTSDMTKEELSNLLELIHAFGAEKGVIFHEPEERAA